MSSTSRVIGIDQSFTSTGVWCPDFNLIVKSNKEDNIYDRAIYVANELSYTVKEYKPTKVVLEGIPFMARSNVTRDLAGLQFLIIDRMTKLGYVLNESLTIVPPTALKKFATGSGKATKRDMINALPAGVRENFSERGKAHEDLADAYFLSKFGE